MKSVLLTGANRGIGLEFSRQFLQRGWRVLASCRHPENAAELQSLENTFPERLTIYPLDVCNETQIHTAVKQVHAQVGKLDLLVNNAGIYPGAERLGTLDAATMLDTLHTNAVGPAMLAQAFAGLLKKGSESKIINITSGMGSISRAGRGGHYSYRASKAALNMLTRLLAAQLLASGITAVALHPGWVRTDMGGRGASLSKEQSVRSMIEVIEGLSLADSGRFLQWDGVELPW